MHMPLAMLVLFVIVIASSSCTEGTSVRRAPIVIDPTPMREIIDPTAIPTPPPVATVSEPATPTPPPPPPTPTPTTQRYVVQAGDTLNAIAASFGVTIEAIVAANDIADPALIEVGEEFIIPGTATVASPAATAPAPSTPAPVTVRSKVVIQDIGTYSKDGQTWKNLQIQAGLDTATLIALAKELHRLDTSSYYRLFTDGSQFKQFMDWDIHYPNDRYPFPEAWVDSYLVGTVQRMLPFGGVGGWGLYSPYQEKLTSVP